MDEREIVQGLLQFIDSSPTAFHSRANAETLLKNRDFVPLDERQAWNLQPGGFYFVTRGGSSIIAAKIGMGDPAETGCRIVAAHTDSPALRIKAESEEFQSGVVKVRTEVYGGPIYRTWLDRPLGIAGSVTTLSDGELHTRLYKSDSALAVVPSLAIHYDREVNKGHAINAQDHLCAVLGIEKAERPILETVLAGVIGNEQLMGADLYLFDLQAAQIIGQQKDLIHAPRIDNQAMCHAALTAFLDSEKTSATQVAVLFDSEEVGSRTMQGAQSAFLRDVLGRFILSAGATPESFLRCLANSKLISADAAHAVHPNFSDKHDSSYSPVLNGGPVVKMHAGRHYTSTAASAAYFENLCNSVGVPVQRYINRSDQATGGTIGPFASANLGVPSVDVGNPLLAMHSIRETAGVFDHGCMIKVFGAFFETSGG